LANEWGQTNENKEMILIRLPYSFALFVCPYSLAPIRLPPQKNISLDLKIKERRLRYAANYLPPFGGAFLAATAALFLAETAAFWTTFCWFFF